MRYLACLLCLLTVACGPAPTPTPVAPRTLTGTGTTDSARFALPAGDYVLRWQGYPNNDPGCLVYGLLVPAADLTHPQAFGQTVSGSARANGLAAGTYYVHVATDCAWGVTVEAAP